MTMYELKKELERRGYHYIIQHMDNYGSIAWKYLIDSERFTEEELVLLGEINGFNMDTLNSAIYARYGYQDLEQLLESEED